MEQLCPEAWLFNYTNPLSALARAVTCTSRIKCLGLCHGILGTRRRLARILGVDPQALQVQAAGINHLTWVFDLRYADGSDAYPALRSHLDALSASAAIETDAGSPLSGASDEAAGRHAAAWRDWEPISYRLLQTYGAYPSPGDRHVAEFYPHFLKARDAEGRLCHGLQRGLDSTYRFINDKQRYWERLRAQAEERAPLSEDLTRFGREGERVVQIMEALLGMTGAGAHPQATRDGAVLEAAVNVPNDGQISNLPEGAIVEVPALIGPFGVRPLAMGSLPPAIAATLEQRIRQQELTVQATLTGDRVRLQQALLADALVDSYDGAVALLEEMLQVQSAHLPRFAEAR
jgi:alpha-galactosidase